MIRFDALVVGFALLVAPGLASAGEAGAPFAGAYVGLNAGAATGSTRNETDPGCPANNANAVFCAVAPANESVNGPPVAASGTGTLSSNGFTGGVQAGYNWQAGSVVYGGEADFGALRTEGSRTGGGTFPFAFLGNQFAVHQRISTDWAANLRGRVGYAVMPQLLLYATGGIAFIDYEVSTSYSDNAVGGAFPGGTGDSGKSGIAIGWNAGAGGEWLLDSRWSLKAEYLHADFGSQSYDVPITNTAGFVQTMRINADLETDVIRIGVNYRM